MEKEADAKEESQAEMRTIRERIKPRMNVSFKVVSCVIADITSCAFTCRVSLFGFYYYHITTSSHLSMYEEEDRIAEEIHQPLSRTSVF